MWYYLQESGKTEETEYSIEESGQTVDQETRQILISATEGEDADL